MMSVIDKRFMSELPDYIVQEIYIQYLFGDFLYKYKQWFFPKLRTKIDKDIKILAEQRRKFKS